jgi:hypothetical protein
MKDFDHSSIEILDCPPAPTKPSEPVVAPVPNLELVRTYRAPLLAASDWTQGADSPLSDDKKAEWATYRQALRDLTNSENIILPGMEGWPTPPSA